MDSARVALERAVEALQRGLPADGDSSVAGGSNAATPVAAVSGVNCCLSFQLIIDVLACSGEWKPVSC